MALNLNQFTPLSLLKQIGSLWPFNRGRMGARYWRGHMIGRNMPVMIDTDDPFVAYQLCPHLRIAIDKKADMFANGMWKCVTVEDETKEIENDPGLVLLKNPNPLQSGEDWLRMFSVYADLFANNYIRPVRGSSLALPRTIWHLPSEFMYNKMTEKIFDQTKLEDIISSYVLKIQEKEYPIPTNEVIYKPDNFSYSDGKGISKVSTLALPISNIVAALKTRNMLAVDKGILGFMSVESADQVGAIPLDPDERKRVEDQFAEDINLFSDRAKVKIVNATMKWNAMSFPTKDLALFEEIEDDFGAILGAFGLDRDMFPSTKGATFENKKQGEIATYQNAIQPRADMLGELVTLMLTGGSGKKKYILDYGWLPIMQKDLKTTEDAFRTKIESLTKLLENNIINEETFAKMADVELTGKPADITQKGSDKLGKLPLAIQQLSLAMDRSTGPRQATIGQALDKLVDTLVQSINEGNEV